MCDKIDKTVCQFIWGGTNTSRACSLVKWEKVTQVKKYGGLGIRETRGMNISFMAKLGWRMMREDKALLANFLVNKYMGGTRDLDYIKRKNGESNAWKGNVARVETLKKGWRVYHRNGKITSFWTDIWFLDEPLANHAGKALTHSELHASVGDYWDACTGWRWDELEAVTPMEYAKNGWNKPFNEWMRDNIRDSSSHSPDWITRFSITI